MIHRHLRENQIRLLQLPPRASANSLSRQVQDGFKFIYTSLDDVPKFAALSYAWGAVTETAQIFLDGSPFTITANLLSILHHLQLEDASRSIWVDAICINQLDLTERGEQVALMQQIYQRAHTVTVYLGPAWPGSALALAFFAAAAAHPTHHFEPSLSPHLVVDGHDASSQTLKQALVHLLSLPWWSRLWTGQEYALARRLVYQVGDVVVEGDVVRAAYANLRAHETSCCRDSPAVARDASLGPSLLHAFFRMDATELARDCAGGHEIAAVVGPPVGFADSLPRADGEETQIVSSWRPWTFLEGLDAFRPREASDARDKVYGLTGLHFVDEVAARFRKADYTVSAAELFTDVAAALIEETGSLEVLGRARGYCGPKLDLPSWVPDWSVGYPLEVDRVAHLSKQYEAAGGRKAEWVVVDRRTARTKAVLVDVLPGRFGRLMAGGADPRAVLDDWATLAGFEIGDKALRDQTGMFDRTAPFWRVLCGNMVGYHVADKLLWALLDLETDVAPQAEKHAYQSFMAWYAGLAERAESRLGSEVAEFEEAFVTQCVTRKFGVTAAGRLGNVPQMAEEGDVVAVLSGGHVPFVLRQVRNGTFEVVGPAYIHGIMMGEALRGEPSMESILLV